MRSIPFAQDNRLSKHVLQTGIARFADLPVCPPAIQKDPLHPSPVGLSRAKATSATTLGTSRSSPCT